MAAREPDSDLLMTVRLENCSRVCNVLVSTQTTGRDVIECLKPDDDKFYYLVEIWKGCERPITHDEKLKNVLLQWGSDLEDVTFMLKEKLSRQNSAQKRAQSPHSSSPGTQFQDHVHEQQLKVESMEKELEEKEKYLHSLRAKDSAKNGLKSSYVRRLELRVLEQEEQLKHLQNVEKEVFKYQVENEKLALELHRVRSMFAFKHQQLAEASARIELLTRELALKRRENMVDKELELTTNEPNQEKTQNESQQVQRSTVDEIDNQPAADDREPVKPVVKPVQQPVTGQPASPLTEKQLFRLTDSLIHKKHHSATSPVKNSVGFFKPFTDNDDDTSSLSCRDDEENDTETSADSGHVSVDSPSYQAVGMGSSFYFNGAPSGLYMGKVDRFDMDQELYTKSDSSFSTKELNKHSKMTPGFKTLSQQSQSSAQNQALRKIPNDATYPLSIQTATEMSSRGQPNLDSPQSTSSLSSQSSQLSDRPESRLSKDSVRQIPRAKDPSSKAGGPGRSAGSIHLFQRRKSDTEVPNIRTEPLNSQGNTTTVKTPGAELVQPERKPPVAKRRDSNSPVPKERTPKVSTSGGGFATTSEKRTLPLGQPVPSIGVQDLLKDVSKLNVSGKDNKGFQIQTIAEKESAGSDVKDSTRSDVRTLPFHSASPDSRSTEGLTRKVPPIPVPRKRTKTPPVRNSKDPPGNLVVTSFSTTNRPLTPTSETAPTISEDSTRRAVKDNRPAPKKAAMESGTGRGSERSTGTSAAAKAGTSDVTSRRSEGAGNSDVTSRRSEGAGNSDVTSRRSEGAGNSDVTSRRSEGAGTSDVTSRRSEGAGNSDVTSRRSKGAGTSKKSGKRVSLDPHAVLLHASLDGELDVVQSIIHQVEDPSFPNNEGLTALHHAVCNNHGDIVKFLVEYGCDINAADMQGWTSLHCAAANNSTNVCQYLVNHGACVLAVTAIEGKTPSRCCEKDSKNFQDCFFYLDQLESNFGVMNEGVVYAVYAYEAARKDELSFECGGCLTVVRRGDVTEKEWWWARDAQGQLGYIPRNLLGLAPRVAPDV